MLDPEAVFWPSIFMLVLGVSLLIASSAAFGRILADLEYQYAAGLNGVRRIQSKVNLRTHGNRIVLAVFAMVIGVTGLTTLPIVWQNQIANLLFLLVLLNYTASSIVDWIDERRQVSILLEDRLEEARLLARHVELSHDHEKGVVTTDSAERSSQEDG